MLEYGWSKWFLFCANILSRKVLLNVLRQMFIEFSKPFLKPAYDLYFMLLRQNRVSQYFRYLNANLLVMGFYDSLNRCLYISGGNIGTVSATQPPIYQRSPFGQPGPGDAVDPPAKHHSTQCHDRTDHRTTRLSADGPSATLASPYGCWDTGGLVVVCAGTPRPPRHLPRSCRR